MDRFKETNQRRVGKIAWHRDDDCAEPGNSAHAISPRGTAALATRRHAVLRYSTLRRWRIAHLTKSSAHIRAGKELKIDG
jgi:hypothetical protein